MNVLFVSRAFPPTIGGIEKQNSDLASALNKICFTQLIRNPYGKKFLPLFLPYALFSMMLKSRKADVILLGDAVLSPLGVIVQAISKKPCFCIVHGLDISFRHSLYQHWVIKKSLPKMQKIFAVGNATKELAITKGLDAQQIIFIPNGVNFSNKQALSSPYFIEKIQQPFCLSLGRLIKRKGVVWFIDNVAAKLGNDIQYVIAGTGPEEASIQKRLQKHKNVLFLGKVTENEKLWLYRNSLCFVQANIPIEDDIEGFGLVVLEACTNDTIVIASKLEGLKDAIKHTKNGYLVESQDTAAFVKQISLLALLNDDEYRNIQTAFHKYSVKNYDWKNIAQEYLTAMDFSS